MQVEICNNTRLNDPEGAKRVKGSGSHWVVALWRPCDQPGCDMWVFEPWSDAALLNTIMKDLPEANICQLGWQTDCWRCGYYSLWIKILLLLKLDSAKSWPCSTEKEWRQWFHACQPPSMYFRIVWRLLEWRDDHIAHPARATPTWEPNFEVTR